MQISNVQQLMRMELRPPTARTWQRAMDWYLDGVRALAPRTVSEWGWRAKSRLIELDRHGKIERRHIAERSTLGARRLIPDDAAQNLPIDVALPDANIYRTQLSLPPEAANNIANTVGLRLDQLSPIPPEDSCFAIGNTEKTSDGRIKAEIALTKKKTIAAVKERFANADLGVIGAAADQVGTFGFTFETGALQQQAQKQRWISPVIMGAAFVLCSLAIDVHLSQQQQALESYEVEILSALKDLRPARALFDSNDSALLQHARSETSLAMLATLQTAFGDLPAQSRIENLTLNNNSVAFTGWTPEQAGDVLDPENFQRMTSQRPGFDRFTYDYKERTAP